MNTCTPDPPSRWNWGEARSSYSPFNRNSGIQAIAMSPEPGNFMWFWHHPQVASTWVSFWCVLLGMMYRSQMDRCKIEAILLGMMGRWRINRWQIDRCITKNRYKDIYSTYKQGHMQDWKSQGQGFPLQERSKTVLPCHQRCVKEKITEL
jgi:hypothetical protein